MALTNHERVGQALRLLSEGLAPFVKRQCRNEYGNDWVPAVANARFEVSPTDAQFLLRVITEQWEKIFRKVLGRVDRTYVNELQDIRNRWAHQNAFSTDDAYRALDTVQRLLLAASAADEAAEAERMRQDLARVRFEEQARQVQRRAAVTPVEGHPTGGLKPWRQVVSPNADVAEGRYQQAEFTADLHQVYRGEAAPEYDQPVEFFRRTFLTEGLRNLLLNAVRRFRGEGGDPVVQLQTNFGGGKTHSLIALYHLAAGHPPHELPGVEAMLATAGLQAPPPANTAVLVGQMISPGTAHPKSGGVTVHTLWGELAWQLGGVDGYALVADADRTGTSPGAALVELLRRHSPCLILIDEWVAYARQLGDVGGLPGGSFDVQFTFAQALAEAARAVKGALLVVSIPASDIEVGGEYGRAALERLQNVIGRIESSWRTASAEEGFEIVRRRLFDDLPASAAPERDAVVKAFGDLYRSHRGEFPAGCAEAHYERRLKAAYPIHPELFDRLYDDWSTLEKFQRTRGVLRLMAAVVHELWQREDANLLIMPGMVPIDAAAVSAELTRYLEDQWTPVIASDVDGPDALPLQLDRPHTTTMGRHSATRRVARTVYLGSAPIQTAANRGIDDRRIKLGCVQPGEAPALFGDALRRLADHATYLYVEGQRYWYSPQASIMRLARDRAASSFSDDNADEEIRQRLRATTRPDQRGDFARVHPAPAAPAEVPDEQEVRLVVLGPEHPHLGKHTASPARAAAERFLHERAGGDRLYRNMLVFLAPDAGRLTELRKAVREFLAWRSIDDERDDLDLGNFQRQQAQRKRADSNGIVDQRVREAFMWVFVPYQTAADPAVEWEELRVSGTDPLAVRVSRQLDNEHLITQYAAVHVRKFLDSVPLWRGDHVGVRQLWSYYSQYPHLHRLRDSTVLLDAIRQGVALLTWNPETFAYASAFDEASGRYLGLVAGEHAAVVMDSASVLVRPEAAARQIAAERAAPAPDEPGAAVAEAALAAPAAETSAEGAVAPAVPRRPTRFYGRVAVAPVRMLRDLDEIAEAVVAQLSRADAEIAITVEVEATAANGFDDDVRRTVDENARTLRFDEHEFEA